MTAHPDRDRHAAAEPQEPTRVQPHEDWSSAAGMPRDAVSRETLPAGAEENDDGLRFAGRYQIVGRIGRGGMATVYKAYDPKIERSVAVKFLQPALSEDPGHAERFLREARAAGSLSHPNIVTVYDVGEIGGRPYMAMELLDGVPLSDVMARGQPMPLKDVLEIGIQLAQALDYAHHRGIVHRDIKPGNIMRLRGGNTVKVTDFGIAHVKSSGSAQNTQVGDVIGTPQYMSPEQALGHAVDGRSDLFAVGIVLYQMLTGERPFDADTVVVLALKITQGEPPPLQRRRPDVPAAVRRIVERCLQKSPEHRYQSGHELAEALTRALWDLLEEQRQKSQPRMVPLRIKWAVLMALMVAVVMAGTAVFITQRQSAALLAQVTDYGASLARFLAAQNVLSVVGDEWVAVDVAVQEVMKTRDFQSISVLDHQGVVRVSSEPALVGLNYQPPPGESLGVREGGVSVRRYTVGDEGVLGFEAPVVFQGQALGRVALGLPERPLARMTRLTGSLLATLVIVTVLAVAVAMYLLATWFARPIRLLGQGMAEISRGHFDHRIQEQRRDEFGLLFRAFDQMAEALQRIAGPRGQPLAEMLTGQRRAGSTGRAAMSVSAVLRPGARHPATIVPQQPVHGVPPGSGAGSPPTQPGPGRPRRADNNVFANPFGHSTRPQPVNPPTQPGPAGARAPVSNSPTRPGGAQPPTRSNPIARPEHSPTGTVRLPGMTPMAAAPRTVAPFSSRERDPGAAGASGGSGPADGA